jgi:tetratricopeptide (TPR) repeat protein
MPRSSIDRRAGDRPAVAERSAPRALLLGALVAACATLPYLNGLRGDFCFDDVGVIRDNPVLHTQPSVALLWHVYEPGGLYRPLTMLTYAANAAVSDAPFGYHLVNIALHVLVSLAGFALAWRMLGSASAGVAVALLFAVHPIHSEAVTGIVGRAELLAALGALLALLCFERAQCHAGAARRAWSGLSLAAFAAGLLAKESAFTALGLLAALHWWLDRQATLRRRMAVLLPYGAVAAVYLGVRFAVVGSLGLRAPPGVLDNALAHVDAWTRLRTAAVVLWDYLALLTVPLHLSADYSYNQIPIALTWDDPRFVLAAALLTALAVGLTAGARRAPVLAMAALFTAVSLALTANLLFPIGTIMGERLLYLPSLGWCLAVGWLAAAALRRRPAVAAVALAALVAAFGARTWVRNADWRDDATLFAATAIDAPNSAKAHFNGAVALQQAGRFDDAMVHYRRALAIYPDYAAAALGIGQVYGLRGADGAALHWYEQALQRDPNFVNAHLQMGLLHERRGEYDAAEAAFLSGLASDPIHPMLLVNLSAVRLAQGDRWGATAVLARLNHIDTLDREEHELVAAARREIEVALR